MPVFLCTLCMYDHTYVQIHAEAAKIESTKKKEKRMQDVLSMKGGSGGGRESRHGLKDHHALRDIKEHHRERYEPNQLAKLIRSRQKDKDSIGQCVSEIHSLEKERDILTSKHGRHSYGRASSPSSKDYNEGYMPRRSPGRISFSGCDSTLNWRDKDISVSPSDAAATSLSSFNDYSKKYMPRGGHGSHDHRSNSGHDQDGFKWNRDEDSSQRYRSVSTYNDGQIHLPSSENYSERHIPRGGRGNHERKSFWSHDEDGFAGIDRDGVLSSRHRDDSSNTVLPLSSEDYRKSYMPRGSRGRGRGSRGRSRQLHSHQQYDSSDYSGASATSLEDLPKKSEELMSGDRQGKGDFHQLSGINPKHQSGANKSDQGMGCHREKDKSWLESVRPISITEIFQLSKLQPENLVNTLFCKIKAFQGTLRLEPVLTKSGVMEAILKILSRTATVISTNSLSDIHYKACQILGEVLSERCAVFQIQLKLYISQDLCLSQAHSFKTPYSLCFTNEEKVITLCDLFSTLLRVLPSSSWSVLPINELSSKIDEMLKKQSLQLIGVTSSRENQLSSKRQDLLSLHDSAREQHTTASSKGKGHTAQEWDNSEYKSMSILPSWKELCVLENSNRRLRKNIVEGSYSGWLHYYDVQFRLLREDFIAPLRNGINDYFQGLHGRKLKNVRIYKDVIIEAPVCSESGVCYRICIDVSHFRGNWAYSKRLLYGSLLCLSPDDFKDHIFFATVVSRDTENIEKGKLDIMFQDNAELLNSIGTSFKMVESCAYFEGSRHILRSLQTAEEDTMPFTKYLIAGECHSVNQPQYLAENTGRSYDLSLLLKHVEKASLQKGSCVVGGTFTVGNENVYDKLESGISSHGTNSETTTFKCLSPTTLTHSPPAEFYSRIKDVSNITLWPSLDLVELDESQLAALQAALTQEIAIIQGPPGTGKTYIGLRIVETLLKNKQVWNSDGTRSPILVMCFTNHALDQFLEGILASPLYESMDIHMVRIGSRSKSEKLNDLNIRNLRKNVYLPREVHKDMSKQSVNQCEDLVQVLLSDFIGSADTYVPFQKLVTFMHPDYHYYFTYGTETPQQQENNFLIWLGVYKIGHEHPNQHSNQLEPEIIPSDEDNGYSTESMSGEIIQGVPTIQSNVHVDDEDLKNSRSTQHLEHGYDSGGKLSTSSEDLKSKEEEENEDNLIDLIKPSSPNQENVTVPDGKDIDNSRGVQKLEHGTDFGGKLATSREDYEPKEEEENEDNLIDLFGDNEIELEHRLLDEDEYAVKELMKDIPEPNSSFAQPPCSTPDFNTEDSLHYEQDFIVVDEERAAILKKYLDTIEPMDEEEVMKTKDISKLTYDDRLKLYRYWHLLYCDYVCSKCEEEFKEYNRLCSELGEVKKRADRFALETADVIGMTTTGAAKYQHILHLVKPRIVIVEEAAEVLESHIVSALNAGTQHLILIGDHKQLRPKPNEYELAKKYRLDVSLFERLILNKYPHVTLNIQHRMRPEIAQLVKPHIYDTLFNHSSVEEFPNIRGVSTNLYFISHDQPEYDDDHISSHSNVHEAQYLIALCRYLLQQNYSPSQVTILVTYSGQLLAMRKLLPKSDFEGVKLSTVDNFQGEENDIILLSLVRSNKENSVGFLKEENRVCVALSRARQGFYCIGNFKMLRDQAPIWESIMSDMESKDKLGDGLLLRCSNHPETEFVAKNAKHFRDNSPKGGCNKDCSFRLSCGHVCTDKCHYTDPEHLSFKCLKTCTKACPYDHPCKNECSLPCRCKVRVTRPMELCGHQQEMLCFQNPISVNCTNPCKKLCHKQKHCCPLLCHQVCKPCNVEEIVEIPSCLHKQSLKCHEDPSELLCKSACSWKCPKGHPCPKKCHEPCGNCEVKVLKMIPQCSHSIELSCYIEPDHENCTEPCEKMLPCKHRCGLTCGELCSSAKCEVPVVIELECQHQIQAQCWKSQTGFFVECDKKCNRKLPCGHKCDLKCSEPCKTKCQVKVNKTWPCGHKLKRSCFQTLNPDEYPCEKKCEKKLVCGHICPNICSEPCVTKCLVKTKKKYPCGHLVDTSCSSTPSESPCKILCQEMLPCGHACSGQCSHCTSRNIHEPCTFSVSLRRFCGHQFTVPCRGLMDVHPGKKQMKVSCSHGDHKSNCTIEKYLTCNKPCEWSCVHFSCSKACSEICDRPRCDEQCQLKLKCGHRCYGICGEPCLSICPECQLKKFNQKLKSTDIFDQSTSYYQLTCGHIFTVKYLDDFTQHIHTTKSPVLVSPLLCPVKGCSEPLNCSFRYGYDVRTLYARVQDVDAITAGGGIHHDNAVRVLQDIIDEIVGRKSSFEIHAVTDNKSGLQLKHNGYVLQEGAYVKYKPIPTITLDLFQLQDKVQHANNEEKYLIFMFSKIVKLVEILFTWEATASSDTLKRLAQFILLQIQKHQSKLTYQLASDLEKEYFRQCLTLQCRAIRHTASSALHQYSAIDEAEAFLKEVEQMKVKVTREKFLSHMIAMSKHSSFDLISADMTYGKILSEIDLFYPVVQKGLWWRCTSGHYYCTPASMLDEITHECPKCKGSHMDVQLPLNEPAAQSFSLPPDHQALHSRTLQEEDTRSRQKPTTQYFQSGFEDAAGNAASYSRGHRRSGHGGRFARHGHSHGTKQGRKK